MKNDKQTDTTPAPKAEPKLPTGARVTRHGNIVVDGTVPPPPADGTE